MEKTETIWPIRPGSKVLLSGNFQGSGLTSGTGYVKEIFSYFGLGYAIVHFPQLGKQVECPVKELRSFEK
jgi:hypothetical protein